jgi:hypothetical protein
LHFKKSDESDLYFFNRYSLLLKNEKKWGSRQANFLYLW